MRSGSRSPGRNRWYPPAVRSDGLIWPLMTHRRTVLESTPNIFATSLVVNGTTSFMRPTVPHGLSRVNHDST